MKQHASMPRMLFPLIPSPRYLFIAGGIGITPIVPMVRAAEAAAAEWRLLYGGRDRQSMAFLNQLQNYGDRVTVAPQNEAGLLDFGHWLATPEPYFGVGAWYSKFPQLTDEEVVEALAAAHAQG